MILNELGAGIVRKVARQTAGGLGDGNPPAGSMGGAPVEGSGGRSPPEAEALLQLRWRIVGQFHSISAFQSLTFSLLCSHTLYDKKLSYRLETGRQQCIFL